GWSDAGRLPTAERCLDVRSGGGTVDLEDARLCLRQKLLLSLVRAREERGDQSVFHAVAQSERLLPVGGALKHEDRPERLFLDDLVSRLIAADDGGSVIRTTIHEPFAWARASHARTEHAAGMRRSRDGRRDTVAGADRDQRTDR